ncbi:MAG: AzlD domain-containing protein [Nocardioidaceae bacterium]
MPLSAVLALAVGTYAFRLVGPLLHGRLRLPARLDRALSEAAVVLLVALVAVTAVTEGQGPAGWARPAGVLVALALVLRRAPFPLVVVAAAATTAGLRLLGVA